MSKIYEALLRAEQDRADQEKAGNDRLASGRNAQVLEADVPEEFEGNATQSTAAEAYTYTTPVSLPGAGALPPSPADRATEPTPFPAPELAGSAPAGRAASGPARIPSPDSDFRSGSRHEDMPGLPR